VSGACSRLDALRKRPDRQQHLLGVLGGLFGRAERFLVLPEVVVEQRARPWRDRQLDPFAAPRDVLDGGLDQRGGL
jgi:hypothetical protein